MNDPNGLVYYDGEYHLGNRLDQLERLRQDGRPPMVALDTGCDPKTKNQSQYAAYSNDRGRSFTVHGKVLDIGSTEFRDPKVFWHEPTRRWVMLTVMAVEKRLAIYTSTDLPRQRTGLQRQMLIDRRNSRIANQHLPRSSPLDPAGEGADIAGLGETRIGLVDVAGRF